MARDTDDPEYLERKKARITSRKEAPDKYRFKWRNFIILILMCGGGLQVLIPLLMKIYALAVPSCTHLDVSSTSQLQDVFFGGSPWLIWCEDPKAKSDPMLDRVADYMRGTDIHMGVVDCYAPMPKGDSIITRFRLTTAPPPHPTLLLVANGDRPTVISSTFFADPSQTPIKLLHHIRESVKVTLTKAINQKDFERKCLNRKSCAFIMHQGPPSNATLAMLDTLMQRFRTTRFVWTDVNKKQLSNEKALPLVDHGDGPEWPRMLYFSRRKEVAADEDNDDDNEKLKSKKSTTALYGRAHRSLFEIDPLAAFLDAMTTIPSSDDTQHQPVKMKRHPKLYDRRIKLGEEKKKHEKKEEKKKEKKEKKEEKKKDKKNEKKEKKEKTSDKDQKLRDAADKARERKRQRDEKNRKEKEERRNKDKKNAGSKSDAEKRDQFHQQHEAKQQEDLQRVHKIPADEFEDEEVVNLDDGDVIEGEETPEPAPEVDDDERQHDEL